MEASVGERVARVRERISDACARAGREDRVRLIAVTKGVASAHIDAALAAGVTDVGENRVQEAAQKQDAAGSATWHMLGHVQSNKAARVAALFDVVHSVHDLRIARMLSERHDPARAPLLALIEVELTGQPNRTGLPARDLESIAPEVAGLQGISLVGLMTIAPPGGDDVARPYFARLRELRESLRTSTGVDLPELSMGMSDDFEVAVEEGATMVRVGRAIFGERG